MYKEEFIYEEAKESLRKYGKNFRKSTNEKVIYDSAAIIFSIKWECKEDTRINNIPRIIYDVYKKMIFELQNKIKSDEDWAGEAEEACIKALSFIEIVVGSRLEIKAFAS